MKQFILTFPLVLILFSTQAQEIKQEEKWLQLLENPKHERQALNKQNKKDRYVAYQYSTLLTPKHDFIGYIGKDLQRIYMHFTSISRSELHPEKYLITGVSVVKNNAVEFAGELNIDQIRTYKTMHYGVDEIYKDDGIQAQGVLIASYNFKEDPDASHAGTFEGIMTMNWYLDRNDIIRYDNIEWFSDNYRNNQYVGTWTQYGEGKKAKPCNWGEHRIPFSDDLDMGAGEFSPNPKYDAKGWKTYPR